MLKSMLFKSDKDNDSWASVVNNTDIYMRGMTISTDNKIYVLLNDSDQNSIIVEYSSLGEIQWSKKYTPDPKGYNLYNITIAPDNNFYCSGVASGSPIFTKISSSGKFIVGNYIDRDSGADSMAYSSDNSVYIFGTAYDYAHDKDYATLIKYDLSGNIIWARCLEGDGSIYCGSVAADDSGDNIYICGYTSFGNAVGWDMFLCKYNSSGNLLWKYLFDGNSPYASNGTEYCDEVTVGSDGSVYVCGYTESLTHNWNGDIFFAKFNQSGELQWCNTIGRTGEYDKGLSIAIANDDSIYICGELATIGTSDPNILLAKYSSSGVIQWQKEITFDSHYFTDIALFNSSADNSIYICGSLLSKEGSTVKPFIIKINNRFIETANTNIGPFKFMDTNYATNSTQLVSRVADMTPNTLSYDSKYKLSFSQRNVSIDTTLYTES